MQRKIHPNVNIIHIVSAQGRYRLRELCLAHAKSTLLQ